MDYSVVIKSSLEFVLAGPLKGGKEGIIIRSDSIDADLIGFANRRYQEGSLIKKRLRNSDTFVWSRNYSLMNRHMKFLFCWRNKEVESSFLGGRDFDREEVSQELNKFIENSFDEISKIVSGQRDGRKNIFIDESKILWDISPLILTIS